MKSSLKLLTLDIAVVNSFVKSRIDCCNSLLTNSLQRDESAPATNECRSAICLFILVGWHPYNGPCPHPVFRVTDFIGCVFCM